MRERKHIDRLFQEKFKDFEVTPPPSVWENIQKKQNSQHLEPKRKKRIVAIPLWAKISGVAASLLLLLTFGNTIFTNSSNTSTIVDTTNKEIDNSTKSSNTNTNSTLKNNSISDPNTKIASEAIKTPKVVNATSVANRSKQNKSGSKSSKSIRNISSNNNLSQVAITNTATKTTAKNNSDTSIFSEKQNDKALANTTIVSIDKNAKTGENSITPSNTIADTEVIPEENSPAIEKDPLQTKEASSIEEAIASVESAEKLNNDNSKAINKWKVYANIAPVYYNSLGKGSHIDEQFIDNSKEGGINTSYGVTVGYAINDNMTLRSGLNKLDLSYSTNDAVVYESVTTYPSKAAIAPGANIDSALEGKTVSILSFNNLNVTKSSNSFIENEVTPVALNQKMSYYEVPLEIEHNIVDKRVGVNVIYGMSTFVLDNNEVVSQLDGVNTVIGESNNINPISFSTNLGLGVNYKFTETLKMNVEPTFKYQLNAFENTSGDFNPYVLGVYTGISYNF